MAKPTVLILAAGMGSRYGGLKQIDAMGPNGEAVIDYSVFDAIRAGFGKVVFVIRRDIEADFKQHVGDRFEGKIAVEYVYQELDALPEGFSVPAGRTKPWGTGHAVLVAKDAIAEPFGMINADDFYGRDAFAKLADFLRGTAGATTEGPAPFCMVGFVLKNTLSDFGSVSRGICSTDAEGRLVSVEELTKIERRGEGAVNTDDNGATRELTGEETASMNMFGFVPSLFGHLEAQFRAFLAAHGGEPKSEFYIPFAVDECVRAGQAETHVLKTTSQWFGVTYQEDREQVKASIQALIDTGEYPAKLWDA